MVVIQGNEKKINIIKNFDSTAFQQMSTSSTSTVQQAYLPYKRSLVFLGSRFALNIKL